MLDKNILMRALTTYSFVAAAIISSTAMTAAVVKPTLPAWIHADKYGKMNAYLRYWNTGKVEHLAQGSFSWDFKEDCYRSLIELVSKPFTAIEEIYCNGMYLQYNSLHNHCTYAVLGFGNFVSVEKYLQNHVNDFVVNIAEDVGNPINFEGSYRVLASSDDNYFLYLRSNDSVIEYYVESS